MDLMHDSRLIANRLIEIAAQAGNTLTPMQLLKLVYISHGWMLGLYGVPLSRDGVEAWRYGPVIPELYQAVKSYRDRPVTDTLDVSPNAGEFLEVESDLLSQVYNIYGSRTGISLSRLTHEAGTPWATVYEDEAMSIPIPNDLIEDHYRTLADNQQN